MHIFFVLLAFAIAFLCVECAKKMFDWSDTAVRKILHMVGAVMIAVLPYFASVNTLLVICIFFTLFFTATKFLNFIPSIHNVTRKTFGEVFFPLGIAIATLIFLPDDLKSFQFGILVLGFSDGLAALIGHTYGKRKILFFRHVKSLEGSFTFFLSTLLLFFFFLNGNIESFGMVVLFSFVITLLELFSPYGLDNLLLPVVSGYLLLIVR